MNRGGPATNERKIVTQIQEKEPSLNVFVLTKFKREKFFKFPGKVFSKSQQDGSTNLVEASEFLQKSSWHARIKTHILTLFFDKFKDFRKF